MEKIAFITDSCADIPQKIILEKNIFVVPLKIFCGENAYADGVDIAPEDVYQMIASGKKLCTSLPDGKTVEHIFEKIIEQGYKKVIAVCLSSGLSGTFNMFRLYGEMYSEYLDVRVFDSLNCSLGTGSILLRTIDLFEQGTDWDALLSIIPKLIKNTHTFFCANTLEFLQKGGRIGKIAAITGTLLQIKPILTLTESGGLTAAAKARGKKQAIEKLFSLLHEQAGSNEFTLSIVHGGLSIDSEAFQQKLTTALPAAKHVYVNQVSSAIAVYLGPGMLGASIQVINEKK